MRNSDLFHFLTTGSTHLINLLRQFFHSVGGKRWRWMHEMTRDCVRVMMFPPLLPSKILFGIEDQHVREVIFNASNNFSSNNSFQRSIDCLPLDFAEGVIGGDHKQGLQDTEGREDHQSSLSGRRRVNDLRKGMKHSCSTQEA
jgi:hypothetical protein